MKTRSKTFYTADRNTIDDWIARTPGKVVDVKITTVDNNYNIFVMVLYTTKG